VADLIRHRFHYPAPPPVERFLGWLSHRWTDEDDGWAWRVDMMLHRMIRRLRDRRYERAARAWYAETGECWCQSDADLIPRGHVPGCSVLDSDDIPF